MNRDNKKNVLVIFGKKFPKKDKKWWGQFKAVVSLKDFENEIKNYGAEFVNINTLVSPGSVQDAYEFAENLSFLSSPGGIRLSKLINYRGYELWWLDYDTLYERFCLPYTQLRNLLFFLKDFEGVYLFEPVYPDLFRYFLEAYGRLCVALKQFRLRQLLPVPFGVFLQILLSIWFLPLLAIKRPRLMVWAGDKFDGSHDYDFRAEFIYEELRKRKIPFVEFIRSLEKWPVLLRHARKRKRPVFYSGASVFIVNFFAGLFGKNNKSLNLGKFSDPEKQFRFLVATHYLRNIKGTVWSIRTLEFILRLIGVRGANISTGLGRNFHELMACKLNNIATVGIEHGAASKYYFVSDFMPGFDGKKTLSVDRYGLWSEWWRDYYIKNSNAYKPEQLFVSGPMRPLTRKEYESKNSSKDKLRVLYISEEVAAPEEALPYILTLLATDNFEVFFKFRPYRDKFELWLKENRPEVYKKIIGTAKVFRGTMEEAISQCDVVVGSYSTAVLEALLQLKPFVYYLTNKWGDYYGIKAAGFNDFFAQTPRELLERIEFSQKIPKEDLKKLQEQFFGNPYQNGSKWVVDQIEEFLNSFK